MTPLYSLLSYYFRFVLYCIVINIILSIQLVDCALPPEDEQYIKDRTFAAISLKNLQGRFVFDGEQYDPVCNCKPPVPDHSKKCYPSKVTITKKAPFPGALIPGRLIIDGNNLRKLIGDPMDLKMANKYKHFGSDIDGRSSDEIFGVWGGEFGQMILMLAVMEKENLAKLGVPLNPAQISMGILNYIKVCAHKRQYFYYHTDTDAAAFVENELDEGDIDVTNPPEKYKSRLMKILIKPESVGCRHLKMIMLHPKQYETRKSLIEDALRNFYRLLWDAGSEVRDKIKYYVLHAPKVNGMPNEVGWVDFKVGDICSEDGLFPLFPPWSNGVSIYVNHPQVVKSFHQNVALGIKSASGGLDDSGVLHKKVIEMYDKWDAKTKELLPELSGLPVFEVLIESDYPETEAPEAGTEDEDAPVDKDFYKVGALKNDK